MATAASAVSQVFTVRKTDDKWWLARPDGHRLWSLGVDCTGIGGPGKPGNPAYDGLALFGTKEAWVRDTLAKFKDWGVNTLGGWSDDELFHGAMPYTVVLHLGAYGRAPFNDLYAKETIDAIAKAAADLLPKYKDDPQLIGYFTDNELGWWDDTLFLSYMALPRTSPGKAALVKCLRKYYGDFQHFAREWKTEAKSFAELLDTTKITLVPGTTGIKAVHAFNSALASHYYEMVYRLVRKYDKRHLVLGDRYIQYANIATVRACKPWIDVVSTNAGADWVDGTYRASFFEDLHRMTGKPVMVTEFYFAADENNTGNRNTGEAFPKVKTQAQRAEGFATCLRQLARQPYIVGAHWFQFWDEPPKGRDDGEDWNMGLVDIYGKPYPMMVDVLKRTDVEHIHAAGPPRATPGIPPAPAEPMKGNLLSWDRDRAVVQSDSPDRWADLYVTYSGDDVFIGLFDMEYIDENLHADKRVPEVDRPLLELHVGGWKGSVRFGAGKAATASKGIAEVAERPGLRHILTLRLPASVIGQRSLKRGVKIKLKATLKSRGRGYRMSWDKDLSLG